MRRSSGGSPRHLHGLHGFKMDTLCAANGFVTVQPRQQRRFTFVVIGVMAAISRPMIAAHRFAVRLRMDAGR